MVLRGSLTGDQGVDDSHFEHGLEDSEETVCCTMGSRTKIQVEGMEGQIY